MTWESTINVSGNRGTVKNLLEGVEILYVTDVQVGNAKAASFLMVILWQFPVVNGNVMTKVELY